VRESAQRTPFQYIGLVASLELFYQTDNRLKTFLAHSCVVMSFVRMLNFCGTHLRKFFIAHLRSPHALESQPLKQVLEAVIRWKVTRWF